MQQLSDLESRIQRLRQRASTKGRFLFKKSGSNLTPSQKKALDPEPVTKEQEAAAVADKPLQSSQTQRKRNEYITSATLADDIKTPSEVTLTDLDGCVVDFLERPLSSDARPSPVRTALHINDICNSVLVLGKVDGSAMLHNIERCIIVLKCHQVCSLNNLAVLLLSLTCSPASHSQLKEFDYLPGSTFGLECSHRELLWCYICEYSQ